VVHDPGWQPAVHDGRLRYYSTPSAQDRPEPACGLVGQCRDSRASPGLTRRESGQQLDSVTCGGLAGNKLYEVYRANAISPPDRGPSGLATLEKLDSIYAPRARGSMHSADAPGSISAAPLLSTPTRE